MLRGTFIDMNGMQGCMKVHLVKLVLFLYIFIDISYISNFNLFHLYAEYVVVF